MRLRALIRKEFRQFRRDRRMLGMAIVAPVLQLTFLGYAANLDVEDLPVAVCDQDFSRESARLVAAIEHSGYFIIAARPHRSDDLVPLLDRGAAQLAIHIHHGFEHDLRGGTAAVQVIIDGSDSNSAGIGAGYLGGIIARHGARAWGHELDRAGSPGPGLPRLELRPRVLYNPTLESVYYMAPGVMGLVLLVIAAQLTALSIVKEREDGTLEQVMVTPIRSWELMLGKLIPYGVVGAADVCVVLAVLRLWFRVPLHGSPLLLLSSAVLFLLTCLGIGLLLSTVSRTQQQAQMTMFLVIFPSTILSGFMYPIANMPGWLQPITYAIPLRYFLIIIRSVMLKGSGLVELWPEVLALLCFGVALVAAGAAAFRKRLE
ncbi:MAG: ABC transporter permease [Armatimonadota bacterium]|jgi:ABC-2 type transport system permease protein